MCQNSLAFTQAPGPSADCAIPNSQALALTNGSFIIAEAAQHLQWQEPASPLGPSWRQAQEIPAGPRAARLSPSPSLKSIVWPIWRDKLPPLESLRPGI